MSEEQYKAETKEQKIEEAANKEAVPEKEKAAGAEVSEEAAKTEDKKAAKAEKENTEEETAKPEAETKKDKKDEKIEELTDKYKRLFAEFDNFRKRTDAEKSGMYAEGERHVLEKMLLVLDNFERAMESVPEDLKGCSYVEGIDKIHRSFMDTVKSLGVEPIEALGKEFDANLHNAVMHVEDEAAGENIIVEEFQKGYMFRDKVLRYSMVKVAN